MRNLFIHNFLGPQIMDQPMNELTFSGGGRPRREF